MDIQNILNILLWCGMIVACLMEIFKQVWKKLESQKRYPKDIPSWMGLALGASFSFIVSFIAYMAWLKTESHWLIFIYGLSIFSFQYFVSMEIIKRIALKLLKDKGVDIGGD